MQNIFCFVLFSGLRPLSPYELSRYAVELEKRSIQLSIEEGSSSSLQQNLNIVILPKSENA